MKLTTNFTLEELTATSTGLLNIPDAEQVDNLKALAKNILQPLREAYGQPIYVTSGFRSIAVNKKVNGAAASQHTKGQAADLVCRDNAAIFRIIRDTMLFDQLIWEKGTDMEPDWVHVSFNKTLNRGEVLRFHGPGKQESIERRNPKL